jgi:general nucleoside transport system permease protein
MNLIEAPVLTGLLVSTIRIASPLLFAALGGALSETAGTFAVGIEGMMLMGAFSGTVVTYLTGNVVLGLLCSMLGGGFAALLIAVATVRFRTDHMVTGLAVNILVLGLTSFLLRGMFGGHAPSIRLSTLQPLAVPVLSRIPLLGPVLFDQPVLTYAAFLAVLPLHYLLTHTQLGLKLRAAGENPAAVFSIGSNPALIRAGAIVTGGLLAGLGGAVLPLQELGTFTDGMTNGRGFIALAAVLIGRWNPGGVMLGCLLFGATSAVGLNMQGWGLPVSSYVVQMMPYLIALGVLCAFGRSTRMPAALGNVLVSR